MSSIISLDTETTGLDLIHGCRPFFISSCSAGGDLHWWEWRVDPVSRTVLYRWDHILQVQHYLNNKISRKYEIAFHNSKFDILALEYIEAITPDILKRLWPRVQDTLIASHALASGEPHKLKYLAFKYLGIDDSDERELELAVQEARRIARTKFPSWRLARAGDPHFPTQRGEKDEGLWKFDCWLPRELAYALKYLEGHPWYTVLKRYALLDAERTVALWGVMKEELECLEHYHLYNERRKLLQTTYRMERRGITYSKERWQELQDKYTKEATKAEKECFKLAGGNITNLRSPIQLQKVLFNDFALEPLRATKTGFSTDAKTLETLLLKSEPKSKAHRFINALRTKRKRDTGLTFLHNYGLAGVAISPPGIWYVLYPRFNITGTDTTRFSSSDPNAQNISKLEDSNLRYIFGPALGREWWAADFENIEIRIPAYEAGEKELIDLFESGGSYHLLVASILHPKLYAGCVRDGVSFKERYKSSWYQHVKNGNFAIQYGAQEKMTDATFHVEGAFKTLRGRFPKVTALSEKILKFARHNDYVECLGGYRLQLPGDEYGRVVPTTPFNYHTQGTAGWFMILGMNAIHNYFVTNQPNCYMIMTIHDELVFDLPARTDPTSLDLNQGNRPIIRKLKHLMERGPKKHGIPVPVDVTFHPRTWSEGVKAI